MVDLLKYLFKEVKMHFLIGICVFNLCFYWEHSQIKNALGLRNLQNVCDFYLWQWLKQYLQIPWSYEKHCWQTYYT